MRMEKLTSKFQMALADAQSLAVGLENQFIGPAHLMVALLDQQSGTVRHLLTKSGAKVNLLRSRLGEAVDQFPKVEGAAGEVHISNDLSKLLNVTDKLAQDRGDQYMSSELFALAACDDKGELGRILTDSGVVRGAVDRAIDELRGGQQVNDPNGRGNPPGAGKIHHRSDRTRRAGQTRSDHWSRRRDSPHDADSAAPGPKTIRS